MFFRIPFSCEKKKCNYMEMAKLFGLTVNMITVVSGSSCALSVFPSAHLFSMWLLVYIQLSLVIICWTWLLRAQIYSQHENYLKMGGMRGRNTAIIWGTHTVECSRASFQICLPCQKKGIVAVTAKRRVLQQENHMGCKIKISITGEESRQRRCVQTALLFSACLLEKVANALPVLRQFPKMANA